MCAWCSVTTSSANKLRSPGIQITDNANKVFYYGTADVVGPGQTVGIGFAPGHYSGMKPGPGASLACSIPDLWIPPGWVIAGGLVNFAPDDECTEAHMLIHEIPVSVSLPSNPDQP